MAFVVLHEQLDRLRKTVLAVVLLRAGTGQSRSDSREARRVRRL